MTYISVELRRQVIARAGNCCEYCGLSQEDSFFRFEIDHIVSEKHGGKTVLENLCLCCPDCNAFKGSDIGSIDIQTGQIVRLFDPRVQIWTQHFRLHNGVIEPLTAEGRVTVFLLRLNQPERVIDRQLLIAQDRYPRQK